jgi:Mn2+/Fe2+ NRAMP family transporter
LIGPELLVAAAGIGAGDIVASPLAASAHGLRLLWVVALAAFLKCVLNEGIARWQLASGMTSIEGWTAHLPWWVRIPPASGVPKNSMLTNIVLVFALALFAIVGASEAGLLR